MSSSEPVEERPWESDSAVIDEVERIRRNNNKCWMNILRVAIYYAPEETRSILKQINENDRRINELLGKLA